MMKCPMTTLSKGYFGAHFMIFVAKIMDNIKVVLLSCGTTGRAFDPEIAKQLLQGLSAGKLGRYPFISEFFGKFLFVSLKKLLIKHIIRKIAMITTNILHSG